MELIAIISVGVGLAGLILTGQRNSRLDLESLRAELKSQRAELQAFRVELQAQSAELQAFRVELQAQSAELQSFRAELQAQRTELQSQSAELQSFRAELQSFRVELQSQSKAMQAGFQAVRAEIQAFREEVETKFEKQRLLIMRLGERVARFEGVLAGSIAGKAEREAVLRNILATDSSESSDRVEGVAEETDRQYRVPEKKKE